MQNSIKQWIQQIQQKPIATLSLIKDNQYLQFILHCLDPSFFKAEPISPYDYLVQSIIQYYKKILMLDISHSMLLARKDQDSIQLWVIVLGIAIRCSERNSYIQLILNMDQKTQSSLMGFISRIDDTLAACPSLDLEASKKQNTNLEKHLLNTIDELSEENNSLKTRVEDLEDEINNLKTNKQNAIESLQKQITQLHSQREEILNDYQGVYNTDNLAIIFKAIINENNLLKEIIEKREGLTENIESEREQIMKQLEKMAEENKILNINIMQMSGLQAKIEEQQDEISSLRKNENDLLNKVFVLQRGSSFNRADGKYGQRHHSVQPQSQPIQYSTNLGGDNEETEVKPKKNKYTERLLRSIKHQGHALLDDLSLDERERQYIATIEEQQSKINGLTQEVEKIKDEVQIKKTEIKYSTEKNKEIEEKLRYLEEIKEVYEKNMKDKDTIFSETNEQYAERFGQLMAEIEGLHESKDKNETTIKENQEEYRNNTKKVQGEYEQKLSRVMSMMEGELIGFRNKELEYLEVIRQLKDSKGNQLFNSMMDLRSSAFRMERSSVLESVHEQSNTKQQVQESKGGSQVKQVQNKQQKQEQQIQQKQQEVSASNKLIEELKQKINELQAQITLLTTRNEGINSEFIVLAKQSKEHLQQNIQLKQEISNQRTLSQQFAEKISLFLQKQIEKLKEYNDKQKIEQNISEQTNISGNNEHIKKLQHIVEQIKSIREQRNNNTDDLIEHQNRLKDFLKNELQQMFKFLQLKQQKTQNINKQGNRNKQQIQRMKRQKAERYDRYNLLHKQYQTLKQQNRQLAKQIFSFKAENIKLHKQSLTTQEQKSTLKQKIIQLEHQLSGNKSASLKNYTQVSQLLEHIQKQKEYVIEQRGIQQRNIETKNQQSKSVLKDVNDKLIKELDQQNTCLELFRRQYKELYLKYQHTQQEHRLLLAVVGDLIQEVAE